LSLMVTNCGLWFGWEGSQPSVQSVHHELSNLQEDLSELASLSRRRSRYHVNRPERTILGDRGMSGDHFDACVVNFGTHVRN
jgi:hypothetical protein